MFRSERERELVRVKLLRAHFTLVKKVAYVLDVDVRDSKDATADAILAFLEVPKVIEGRGNKEERERRERSERKKLERARAKAVKQRKKREEEEKKRAEEQERRAEEERNKPQEMPVSHQDSDEDGEEELEFEALSWIEIAQVRREQRQQDRVHNATTPAEANPDSARNYDAITALDSAPAAIP